MDGRVKPGHDMDWEVKHFAISGKLDTAQTGPAVSVIEPHR